MAAYNHVELTALSAPEDAYGYRARAERNGNAYETFGAPDRNDCGSCPAHPETLMYNAAEATWVCAECDLAIDEAERIGAEEMEALFEDREPACTCRQTDVDMFDAIGCELHNVSSERNARQRAATMTERYEIYMPEVA